MCFLTDVALMACFSQHGLGKDIVSLEIGPLTTTTSPEIHDSGDMVFGAEDVHRLDILILPGQGAGQAESRLVKILPRIPLP